MTEDKKTNKPLDITPADLCWLDESLGLGKFFESAGPEGVHALLPSFVLRAYKAGTEIIKEGEKGGEMFVLYKGDLAVLRKRFLMGSKEVARLHAGDFFGEVGFLVGSPRSATVKAVVDSQVFGWSPSDMQRLLDKNQGMSAKLETTARERIARLAGGDPGAGRGA